MHILSPTLGEKMESRRFYHRSQTINHLLRLHFFQPWVCLNPTSLPTYVCMYLMRAKCLGSTTLLDGEKGSTEIMEGRKSRSCAPLSSAHCQSAPRIPGGYTCGEQRRWCEEGTGPCESALEELPISPCTLRSVLLTTMPSGKKEELSNHFQPSV